MESYVRIGGVKNCQNHLYAINEWPLMAYRFKYQNILKVSLEMFV